MNLPAEPENASRQSRVSHRRGGGLAPALGAQAGRQRGIGGRPVGQGSKSKQGLKHERRAYRQGQAAANCTRGRVGIRQVNNEMEGARRKRMVQARRGTIGRRASLRREGSLPLGHRRRGSWRQLACQQRPLFHTIQSLISNNTAVQPLWVWRRWEEGQGGKRCCYGLQPPSPRRRRGQSRTSPQQRSPVHPAAVPSSPWRCCIY